MRGGKRRDAGRWWATGTPGELTTPDPLTPHRTLAELGRGGRACGDRGVEPRIDQRRLTGDVQGGGLHQPFARPSDYHQTIENYHDAKLRLFRELITGKATAVVDAEAGGPALHVRARQGRNGFSPWARVARISMWKALRAKGSASGQRASQGEPIFRCCQEAQVDYAVVAAGRHATGVDNKIATAALEHWAKAARNGGAEGRAGGVRRLCAHA